ncbi:MAG: hypothetical protein CVT49_11800 [candidate division Zixibacteria bacterium HGW-Zixibacteria-1]|nr:MAG: hypothetical protein CVT49_11800 [candidate division Zixibacteria bacterium HGW-Zixibacteria-1]
MLDKLRSKVAIVECNSYDIDTVKSKISGILELLGGLDQYVKPGMKVLLKPNLISAKAPERAITTHPEIVAAVANEVRKLGATPIIGDSPGGAKVGIERVWEKTGMKAMAEREGLELVNFEAAGSQRFRCNGRAYYLAMPAVEADLIINLPKLKTHVLTLMTGAVKNVFGLIPGFRKGNYHKEFPKPHDFAEVIVDILSVKTPALTIMDAVLSMEGDGPSSGEPRWTNLLLASRDPVAVDAIASEIIGLDPGKVPTTRIASDAGLGIGWPEMIAILGLPLEKVRISDFKLTSNRKMELLPNIFVRAIDPFIWIRPAIDRSFCSGCGICVSSCPTGALRLNGDKTPGFNYDLCINCWCCHELCPEKAVAVRKSWLARKFIR